MTPPPPPFSPSVTSSQPEPSGQLVSSGAAASTGASLAEIASFIKSEREEARKDRQEMQARMEQQQAEARAERQQLEARLEAQRLDSQREREAAAAQLERLREDLTPKPAPPLISDEQLQALQTRLEGLHAAELLTAAERDRLEDRLSDFILLLAAAPDGVITTREAANPAAAEAKRLVVLSERMPADAQFARQARRTLGARDPAASPHPAGSGGGGRDPLEAWLAAHELAEYGDAMREAGYTSMRFLQAASVEDLREFAAGVQMKPAHAKVLSAAWRELVSAK